VNEYVSDEERAERIKAWWAENWLPVVGGVVIALVALFAWRGWSHYQESRLAEASAQYMDVMRLVRADDRETAVERGLALRKDYGSTPYAALVSLQLAKTQRQDPQAAEGHLRWVLEHADQAFLKDLARLRLARLLTVDGRSEEALTLLEEPLPEAYAALADEVRGDAYRALDQLDKARQHYDRALSASGTGASRYLRMKRDDLGPGQSG